MKLITALAILTLGTASSLAQDKPALDDARKKFEDADATLNKVLKETSAGLDKTQAAALQKKEQAWLKFRDAASAARTEKASPKLSLEYWQSMAAYDDERIEFLHNYSGKNVAEGIYGEYKDAYDGDLTLDETDNKDGILFSISVVRGPGAHTGQISGIIHQKGDKAYFKEKLDPAEKKKPCELVFTFIDGHIVRVEEESPDPDAEPGVHYDGDYYKTGNPEKNGRPGNP